MKNILSATSGVFFLLAAQLVLAAEDVNRLGLQEGAQPPGTTPDYPLFTDYTAAVVGIVLLVGVLVTLMLVGGMLHANLNLLSKRPQDRIGHRDPSDVGILKHTVWPEEIDDRRYLPAEENEASIVRSPPPQSRAGTDVGQKPVKLDSPFHEGSTKKAS